MKIRIPDDRLVRLFWELNLEFRPEWEPTLLAWLKRNGIELEA